MHWTQIVGLMISGVLSTIIIAWLDKRKAEKAQMKADALAYRALLAANPDADGERRSEHAADTATAIKLLPDLRHGFRSADE